MLVRAPLVEAEQDSSIRIEDLTKVGMAWSCLGLAEERLVPFEASRHIAYADDRPRAFHDISPVGLTRHQISHRWRERAFASNFYFLISHFYFSHRPVVRCIAWLGLISACAMPQLRPLAGSPTQ